MRGQADGAIGGFKQDDVDAPAASNAEARVNASIENWRRKLLDLTKRNRALNFRPNKVTTVTIVDERPAEVFARLYSQQARMRFAPAAAPEALESRPKTDAQPALPGAFDTDAFAAPEGDDETEYIASDFAVYPAANLEPRHTDDLLQTALSPENLDRSLRRIDEQARSTIEEQGVNTLFLAMGMLHYKEADASDVVLRAPLLMLPVELNRGSARAGHTLRMTEDDPIVNPALAETLRKSFGLALPDLPELSDASDAHDLQPWFQSVAQAVAGQAGWRVTMDIHLSFFSFQKFAMYKDLEANAAALGAHRLVRQVVLRSGESTRSLPEEIRSAELDSVFAPENTFQVADADSSQIRALLAVTRGHDLVLEGPPGTGKSQTITNLIAQALAEGKSVLFVAEKMAALDVVHARLAAAGLDEFCLEIHANRANKRAVMREIAAALDASLQRLEPAEDAHQRLPPVRGVLSEYATVVHAPFGALNISPFRAFGELDRVRHAPKVRLTSDVMAVTWQAMEQAERDLADVAAAAPGVGDPADHPWRDTARTFYSEDDLDTAANMLTGLLERLGSVIGLAEQVREAFSLPTVRAVADVHTAAAVAAVLGRSPGAPLEVLTSDAWNSPPPDATDLVSEGRALRELRLHLDQRLAPAALEQEHSADAAFIEEKESGFLRFLNALNGRYRAIQRRWLAYRLPGYLPSLLEQAADMRKADSLTAARERMRGRNEQGRQLFGALWRGEESDWDALEGYIHWVVEFRSVCISHGLERQASAVAARPQPDLSLVSDLVSETQRLVEELARLRQHVRWPKEYLTGEGFTEIQERLRAMAESAASAPRWAAFEIARARAAAGLGSHVLAAGMSREVPFGDMPRAFRRAFLQRWISEVIQQRPALREFATLTHAERVKEFQELDQRVLKENRVNLIRAMRERVQERLRAPEAVEGMPHLRRQLQLQRGLSPVRVTLKRSAAAVRAIKPVFMMSPLTVAQLLDGQAELFDLVIFDEASQLPTEDAAGAILRGRQLVVVGDPKQLPPTNFFSVMSGAAEAPRDEDGAPLFEDSESILEEFGGSGAPSTRLKWHYRSAHESLITFSNVSFYEADLYTFPSVEVDSHHAGLTFEFVPEGVYEGKGLNMAEARRVADAVVRHAKARPDVSLGVGTFNLRQQIAIQDELETRRRNDPSLEPFFSRSRPEPFFVKNLENIQGDERDVIFLSVTYAKDAAGKLRYNFGPLNGENGWRRLNVLTTRARQGMRVYSSMRGEDINPAQAASRGPQLLREFLTYAETGRLDSLIARTGAETDSLFEAEVCAELQRRGIRLQPQVGVSGYRIDIGILDPEVEGRYLCGIECDGAAYHSSESARDRDRLRQQVLEGRGWTIHRLWSTDWFKDREGQVARLLGLIEADRRRATEERDAERAAHEQEAEREWELELEMEAARSAGTPPAPALAQPAPVAAEPYRFASTTSVHACADFTAVPASVVEAAILDVVSVEGPLHVDDLAARLGARWGFARVGPRMKAYVVACADAAARAGKLERRGEFVHAAGGDQKVRVRSRSGTGIPSERIAPEEYRAAVLMILAAGDGRDRRQLTNDVRALFGYNRTGPSLEAAISAAIDGLLSAGVLGEGSTGIRLRARADSPPGRVTED